jgi:hypothetical protein
MRHALALTLALAVLGAASDTAVGAVRWTTAVHSQPGLRIPKVFVTASDPNVAPGFIFVTPRTIYPGRTGPTIVDRFGHVVWFHRQSARLSSQDLRPQMLDGKPVLTWSVSPPLLHEGAVVTRGATPHNTYDVIADSSYHIVKRIRAKGRGVVTDGHEFLISGRNTALVLGGRFLQHAVRVAGIRRRGFVDDLVQEIDIHTGRVLLSWSAARHIPLDETMVKPPRTGNFDPYHLNSISEDDDGNLLVSARSTSTVYKIDRHSGRIIWKLGGKHSDFKVSRGATFYYQHDAVRQADGTITLFDNHSTDQDARHGRISSGKRLRLDTRKKTASLVREYRHPAGGEGTATSQGNTSILANGDAFVGWGINPWFSEYAPDGHLLFGAHFASVWHHSYRAFKGPWVGDPDGDPALVARVGAGRVAAYVSWNGATEVALWRLLGGPQPTALSELTAQPWADFETRLAAPGTPAFVQVQGLDASGAVIGESDVIKTSAG